MLSETVSFSKCLVRMTNQVNWRWLVKQKRPNLVSLFTRMVESLGSFRSDPWDCAELCRSLEKRQSASHRPRRSLRGPNGWQRLPLALATAHWVRQSCYRSPSCIRISHPNNNILHLSFNFEFCSFRQPIIPVFTRNIREALRSLHTPKFFWRWLHHTTRLPIVPIYGGFPVKLETYIGEAIPYDPSHTPESLAKLVAQRLEEMIDRNQPKPGNILRALRERVARDHHKQQWPSRLKCMWLSLFIWPTFWPIQQTKQKNIS